MTLFRRSNDIEVSISPEFDKEYDPGETPDHPGIYRCSGCGCEVVAETSKPLPSENHPKHSPVLEEWTARASHPRAVQITFIQDSLGDR